MPETIPETGTKSGPKSGPEDFSELSKKKLMKRIARARDLLTALEYELERRTLDKQRKSVDKMDEYFDKTDASILNLTNVIRSFFQDKS